MALSFRHFCLLTFIIFLWAANLIAIKYAVMELPPLTAAALRYFCTSLVFLPFLTWPGKKQLWLIFQISFLMYVLHQGLLFIALKYLGASSTSVLLQTQVVFATLLSLLVFKEKIGLNTWSGIGISIIGIVVMLGSPDIMEHPVGSIAVLLSAFTIAIGYIRMKQLHTVHPATYMGLTAFMSVPFLFLGTFLWEPGSWANLPEANWYIVGPIFFFQATILSLTHFWWQRMIHQNDISRVSAFTLLVPVFTVILSVLLLGETITWPVAIGGIMTMAGVAIIMIRRIQKNVKTEIVSEP